VITKYQYKSDFFGEKNDALDPTMKLEHLNNEAIEESVKNGATYRFSARLNNFSNASDIKKERLRFNEQNFQDDGGGILLFPNTYADIKQLNQQSYTVPEAEMQEIRTNVYNYFGVNEDILQSKAYGDAWAAFYEGAIEPFAIQFSEVVTKMLFTFREQSQGNRVMATANRLQYLSNSEKLNVSSQMLDRGIMSINDVREIWNLPPVEGGDTRIIRGEYWNADEKVSEEGGTDEEGNQSV
jgi:hypothetical protein